MDKQILLLNVDNDLLEEIKELLKRRGYGVADLTYDKDSHIDKKIARIFIAIGISAKLKGYKFLREAIKLTLAEPDIINNVTTRLYPKIAGIFGTDTNRVERDIRNAIEVAWTRGKIENINSLFGMRVYNSYEKPTNSEFIALLADKIMLDAI